MKTTLQSQIESFMKSNDSNYLKTYLSDEDNFPKIIQEFNQQITAYRKALSAKYNLLQIIAHMSLYEKMEIYYAAHDDSKFKLKLNKTVVKKLLKLAKSHYQIIETILANYENNILPTENQTNLIYKLSEYSENYVTIYYCNTAQITRFYTKDYVDILKPLLKTRITFLISYKRPDRPKYIKS